VTDWAAGLEAITFDFGNTLVPVGRDDLRRAVELTIDSLAVQGDGFSRDAFLAAWAEERQRQFAEEVPAFREVDIAQRFVRVLARLRGIPAPPPGERWDDAMAAGRSTPEEIAAAVGAYVEGFVAALPAPPTVGPLLERLASRYRLGVLSNWPLAATIDRYVEAAGWDVAQGYLGLQSATLGRNHPVIQEIVNRPGWIPGNSLVLIITGTGHREAASYDGDPAGAALLHVEYK